MSVNVYLISGTDPAAIEAAAAKLVRQVAGADPDPFEFDIVREHEDRKTADVLHTLVQSLLQPSFLGGTKTVWLQNFTSFAAEGSKTTKTADAQAFHRLVEVISAGLPPDIILIISGPDVNVQKALYKACQAAGKVILCQKPQARDRNWQQAMTQLFIEAAAAKNVTLPRETAAFLAGITGTDTGRIDGELEKLICYCDAGAAPLSLAAARTVCSGDGEAVSWGLTDALGQRQSALALELVDALLRREKDADGMALRLLLQVASYFRQLLQVRVFMQKQQLQTPRQLSNRLEGMDNAAKAAAAADGFEFTSAHPFRAQKLAEQALRYSGHELVEAIPRLCEANCKCVSSMVSPRVVLEQVMLALTAPAKQ